mmetsp:Transcript_24387/g.52710  ORF Transcript_24387/g.52710 Transcript_24387/m.52710 type:complete len:115 (+) Transcript_24387:1675-2019(+)
MVTLKLTRIWDSVLPSRARLVLRVEERKALVSRKKRRPMVKTARVERMEPRRVPSRRSTGTLRYMSREARRTMVEKRWLWCGDGYQETDEVVSCKTSSITTYDGAARCGRGKLG